jgi:NAD(P)-dependent dehydrogenase (short-subunit alcohol dehydrogenase family)
MSQVILITGTSSGFGKLMTQTLSAAGHTVIATMRGTTGKNAAVARQLAALPKVDVVELDVTSDESVRQAVSQSLATYGRLDVLVNNAGVTGFGLVEAYSLEQVRRLFEVNLYSVLRTYQAVLPAMRQAQQGLIINLSTGASVHAMPFLTPYMASKFAVEAITEGSQDELRAFHIENVSIQPGPYPTEMNDGTKAGLPADRPAIMAAYGEAALAQFSQFSTVLAAKMPAMNPQVIADGVLALVNMGPRHAPLASAPRCDRRRNGPEICGRPRPTQSQVAGKVPRLRLQHCLYFPLLQPKKPCSVAPGKPVI